MHLATSLSVGLLYVLPFCATAEFRTQREILTYQYPGKDSRPALPRLDETSIDDLRRLFSDGSLTSYDLVEVSHPFWPGLSLNIDWIQAYFERTREINSVLHAVGELNPDALAIARSLDAERTAGIVRG